MKRHSLTLSFLLLSTALVQAQSDAEKAFQATMDDLNNSGILKMQAGSTHYESGSDTLTAQNVVYSLDWALPDKEVKEGTSDKSNLIIKASITVPMMTAKGLKLADGGFEYDSIKYEGIDIIIKVDADGEDSDITIEGKAVGTDQVINGYQPFMGEFKIAPARPIGSVMDYIRPLLLKPKYANYSSDGYTMTQRSADGTVIEQSTYGPMTLTGWENGKIASYEMAFQKGEISIADASAENMETSEGNKAPVAMPEKIAFEVGKTIYQGYDFGALWAALDPKAPKVEGKQTVLKQVDAGNITFSAPGFVEAEIGPSVQKDFAVTQPATHIIPLVDALLAADKAPEDVSPEKQEELIKAGFDLFRGFSMGLTKLGKTKVNFTIPEGEFQGQSGSASIDEIRVANVDLNGIKEISYSGLEYKGPPSIDFSLGRFAIEDLEFPEYQQIEKVIKTSIADKEPAPSDFAKLAPNSLRIQVSDLGYQDQMANKVTAKEIVTEMKRKGLAVPALFSTKIDDLVVSKSLIQHPLAGVLMSQLGLNELSISENITFSWDETSESLKLEPFNIEIANVAKLDGSIGFGGIMRAYLDDPEQAQAAMATASVLPSSLALSDLGGLTELINLGGSMAGMGPEQVRAFAEGQIQATLSAFTKPDFARMVASQVKTFLTTPESLQIILNPGAPVPVAQILGVAATAPQSIPDILSIDVQANQ